MTLGKLKKNNIIASDSIFGNKTVSVTLITRCNQESANKTNSEKVDTLEKILILTAVQQTKPTKKDEGKVTVSDLNLRSAIAGRKYFRNNKQNKEATRMAKHAQKLAKKEQQRQHKQKNRPHSIEIQRSKMGPTNQKGRTKQKASLHDLPKWNN